MMRVNFTVLGMYLTADVGILGRDRPATWDDPAEFMEIEFERLTCNGLDASFLLDSGYLSDLIHEAAQIEAQDWIREELIVAEIERAEARREEMWL